MTRKFCNADNLAKIRWSCEGRDFFGLCKSWIGKIVP